MVFMERGLLIVFEGGDRTGKSTQCSLLLKSLQELGHKVRAVRFPDRTTATGKLIDQYLKGDMDIQDDRAIHLLFSANRWESFESMKQWLQEGYTLVIDRYIASGIAFSVAKGLDMEWCIMADCGLLRPDLTFFFDLLPEQAAARADYGNERFEKLAFQSKVYEAYALIQDASWKRVDASKKLEDIQAIVLQDALAALQTLVKLPMMLYSRVEDCCQ